MENQKQFQCSGNCLGCIPAQRAYCASQHTYNNMRMLEQLLSGMKSLEEKVEALQNNEASVFDPTQIIEEETAQKGDGAEE